MIQKMKKLQWKEILLTDSLLGYSGNMLYL